MSNPALCDHLGTTVARLRGRLEAIGEAAFLAEQGATHLIALGGLDALYGEVGGELTRQSIPRRLAAALAGAASFPPTARVWAVRKHHAVFPAKITVGRMANNDVVIPHPSISKFHAFFTLREPEVVLSEAGSRNGSMHNGVRITSALEPRVVRDGDIVQFGAAPEMLVVGRASLIARLVQGTSGAWSA